MATADNKTLVYCEKCHRTMREGEFYLSNNLEKYPNKRLNICKKCLTMHVDNWNPDTFLWILQELDVPYVPSEWSKVMLKYAKDRTTVTGTTILGRYLAKMRLNQWRNYRWADTAYLQEAENNKMELVMRNQGYSQSEIDQAIAETPQLPELGEDGSAPIPPTPPEPEPEPEPYYYDNNGGFPSFESYALGAEPEPDIELGLTEEDITMLRLKWGKSYKQSEWVQLEQLYNEMMESYEITSAGHIDTLKLLCKTSLKCHQLIDLGDIEGYQKASKVYDQLMKSGKFKLDYEKLYQFITGVAIAANGEA